MPGSRYEVPPTPRPAASSQRTRPKPLNDGDTTPPPGTLAPRGGGAQRRTCRRSEGVGRVGKDTSSREHSVRDHKCPWRRRSVSGAAAARAAAAGACGSGSSGRVPPCLVASADPLAAVAMSAADGARGGRGGGAGEAGGCGGEGIPMAGPLDKCRLARGRSPSPPSQRGARRTPPRASQATQSQWQTSSPRTGLQMRPRGRGGAGEGRSAPFVLCPAAIACVLRDADMACLARIRALRRKKVEHSNLRSKQRLKTVQFMT